MPHLLLFRYEQRNVGIIRFVVMLVMVVIGVLVLYLLVVVLEPILRARCSQPTSTTVEQVLLLHDLQVLPYRIRLFV